MLAAALFAAAARSQSPETVIVSATPPDPVGNTAFSVSRLDAAAFGGAPQLDVALSRVPGLSLFRRNSSLSANPTTQGVSLRSIAPSGAGRSLVTLEGVPQNDPFGGWVIWSSLPPEDIAEAQVVRGAGAGPYGAGALTGVIALKEAAGEGVVGTASGGSMGFRRAAATAGDSWGRFSMFASASAMASNGWVPVLPPQRGAADDEVTLDARNASLRLQFEPDSGTLVSARVSVFREARHSGLIGTASQASGVRASLTVARPQTKEALGWRAQLWLQDSDFRQTSASVSLDRSTVTPSNGQYATPAFGWGANAALRGSGFADWEIGADVRAARGHAKEHAAFIAGAFTIGRVSGGNNVVGGMYAEAAKRAGDWLFTLGLRADAWSSSNGRLTQTDLSTGAVTSDTRFPSRSGVLPTARAGVRRDFGSIHLRAAAYEGFHAPSLNELYRPFRLGNNVTIANPALSPEKLYGVEIGAGGGDGRLVWDVTLFWNQLHDAVTNVTIGQGPGTFPGAGFVPAGGLLIQRRNAGDINAPGIEGSIAYAFEGPTLRAAFILLDQRVHGGAAAPQLTYKRPPQAPRATITGGFDWELPEGFSWSAGFRFESTRFADDANGLNLGPAFIAETRLTWSLDARIALFVAADNLFDARTATTMSADGIVSTDAPRLITAGISFKTG